MTYFSLSYQKLETSFVEWAKRQPTMRAAVVVGSRARADHPADRWSDLDIICFTSTPDKYTNDSDWLRQLGNIWFCSDKIANSGDFEWMVLFEGGYKVDFIIAPAAAPLTQMLASPIYELARRRGVRVLLDKTSAAENKMPLEARQRVVAQPSEADFLREVNLFWILVGRTATTIGRGELWRAMHLCDNELKQRLLTMIEWHARATYGPNHDIWRNGRFLHEWAASHVPEQLARCFANFNRADLYEALWQTSKLFSRLAREVTAVWEYSYPHQSERHLFSWLEAAVLEPTTPDFPQKSP